MTCALISRRGLTAGLVAAPLTARAATSPLEDLVARHTAARGGAARLDAVRNMQAELEIEEQGATLAALYRASVDGQMRIDILVDGKRVFSEGLDGDGAWAWSGRKGTTEPLSADGAAALRHGIDFNLFGLHAYPRRGHRLTLAGDEPVGGVRHPVIQIDMADGFRTFRYLDPRTFLVARSRDVRAFHPDIDATKKAFETVFEDYRPVDGVMVSFASRQFDLATGKLAQRTRLIAQRHNLSEAELALARS